MKLAGKNILCIDYGSKVLGLATYAVGRDPYPLKAGKVIAYKNPNYFSELETIIKDEFFDIIVIGLPTFLDGSDSEQTKIVRKFKDNLTKSFPSLQIDFQNEAHSTQEAKERMINSAEFNFRVDMAKIDELSAVIILESYMQSNN